MLLAGLEPARCKAKDFESSMSTIPSQKPDEEKFTLLSSNLTLSKQEN
jgi:hypothetical protein